MSDDDGYRREAVAVIVGAEMICPDDHWNDAMETRPDASWNTRYHIEGDHVEFSGRPDIKDKEAWINAYIEAEDQVIDLWRSGHKKARAILDLHYELAYTCDDCGLWAHVEHVNTQDLWSEEVREGALFSVQDCDPDNRRRIHGRRITPEQAWAREAIVYEGDIEGRDLRRSRDFSKYNAQRKAKYWRDKEAKRAATTEEY